MPLDDLLVCPLCRAPLPLTEIRDTGVGACPRCAQAYRYRSGAYDMTPDPPPDVDVQEQWAMWEKLQENGALVYSANPTDNLSVGRRTEARLFGEFADLDGVALDIGCGPQAMPSYGTNFPGRFIGIDPLPGVQPRKFEFVQGIGEYLPFRDGTFDRVLFATSLDHTLVPSRALREAHRILKPSGKVSIWFGQHDPRETGSPWRRRFRLATSMLQRGDLPALITRSAGSIAFRTGLRRTPTMRESFTIPEGADDHFHAIHVDPDIIEVWLEEAGLVTVKKVVDDEVGCFVMAGLAGT